ncbi:MAG: carbamoyl phosphate synthase small subunit [Lachnospiraceae bacterium]|nr:carbamoyl phosphate synthase small subunit [Lachnospiraceae bacterium]
MNSYLILEDGTVYQGTSIGAVKEVISEIVFNTSMTGYLEVMTDPSYVGQAVVMTYPLIGNYGICFDDMESRGLWLDAFIVRELSEIPSNWRSENTIQNLLKQYAIPGICGIDTRALTKHLRDAGTMNGMLTNKLYEGAEFKKALDRIKEYKVTNAVNIATEKNVELFPASDEIENANKRKVALLDLGAKRNIIRSLQNRGLDVIVYPADAKAEDIIKENPDGIMLSNGPGDPKENVEIIKEIKKLYDTDIPIFAICLGHQLMALATGADTYKLKFGHRGGNHPVKDVETGRVYITSQNHGYAVDMNTVDPSIAVEAYKNVNDNTNEGLRYLNKNIVTVQFHPEASPGPKDSEYLFDKFIEMMEVKHA